jgi:uroporphyrin-III C-methyltransferase/precorrin-2 dehydrogenase/sirohydrochlorin ferrochelatase
LDLAPKTCERIAVGRRCHGVRHHDEKVHPAIVERALAGVEVVRLKGGDPLIFGRGGEELEQLALHKIEVEIVAGITSALGAAASVQVPLTHRDLASSVTFVTAHDRECNLGLPSKEATLVFYMGLSRLAEVAQALIAQGSSPSLPVVVVSQATTPFEHSVFGTLANIAVQVSEANLQPPALMIVGRVIERSPKWEPR